MSAIRARPASGRAIRSRAGRASPGPCTRRAGASCCSSGTWAASRIRAITTAALPVAPSAIAASGHVSLIRPQVAFETPRALETERDPRHRRGLPPGRGERQGRRLRRRRDPRRQRLPARPVPAGRQQQAHRRLRRTHREPRAPASGGDRCGALGVGRRAASACTWRRGPIATRWAIRTGSAPSAIVARELGKRRLAFICAREALGDDRIGPQLKQAFGGVYIANERFDQGNGRGGDRGRRSRCRRLRQGVHRQPGSAPAVRPECAPQQVERRDVLLGRSRRLHGLPRAGLSGTVADPRWQRRGRCALWPRRRAEEPHRRART